MNICFKTEFEVKDDVVIKYTPVPGAGENIYKSEVIMTKEVFQECYKKWIEPQESEVKECSNCAKSWTDDCPRDKCWDNNYSEFIEER